MPGRRVLTLAATALLSVVVLVLGTSPRVPSALRKVPDWYGHASCYAVLGVLASRSAGYLGVRPVVPWAAAYSLGHGVLLELLQTAVPTRSAEWGDVLADAIGTAAGVALAALWRRR